MVCWESVIRIVLGFVMQARHAVVLIPVVLIIHDNHIIECSITLLRDTLIIQLAIYVTDVFQWLYYRHLLVDKYV